VGAGSMGSSKGELDRVLFAEIYPALWRFASAVCDADLDPDDVVQEAVAQVLRRQPLSDLEYPSAYLKACIVNLVKNSHRSRSRQRSALQRTRPEAEVVAEYPSEVAALLFDLGADDRAALYLVDVERLSHDDAAALLGCSTPALRKRVSRARAHVRRHLEAER